MSTKNTKTPHPRASTTDRADPAADEIPLDETATAAPIADKGEAARPVGSEGRTLDGGEHSPGTDPQAGDASAGDSNQELDFDAGRIEDDAMTQGDSVVDAEYADREADPDQQR